MNFQFQVGDYAETDRHYGQITWDYGRWQEAVRHGRVTYYHDFELHRLECLHGPQKDRCTPYERVRSTQLKPMPPPEVLVAEKLGEDYL